MSAILLGIPLAFGSGALVSLLTYTVLTWLHGRKLPPIPERTIPGGWHDLV